MVVVLERDEAERLQYSAGHLSHGTQDFRHAVNRAGLRLKSYFNEVALRETLRQLEQAAGYRDGL